MRTLGLEVLVHEVMAAMSTSPEPRSVPSEVFTRRARSSAFLENPFSATGLEKSSVNLAFQRRCASMEADDDVVIEVRPTGGATPWQGPEAR